MNQTLCDNGFLYLTGLTCFDVCGKSMHEQNDREILQCQEKSYDMFNQNLVFQPENLLQKIIFRVNVVLILLPFSLAMFIYMNKKLRSRHPLNLYMIEMMVFSSHWAVFMFHDFIFDSKYFRFYYYYSYPFSKDITFETFREIHIVKIEIVF